MMYFSSNRQVKYSKLSVDRGKRYSDSKIQKGVEA